MDKKRKGLLAAGIVLLAITAAACGGNNGDNGGGAANGGESTPAEGGGTVSAHAEEVYKANCISCHAVDLGGGVGPNLQKIGATESAEKIRTQIENGGGGMPAYKGTLSDADITALTDWLAAKK